MSKNNAPNFKLVGTSNKIVELKKIKSEYIILYFYPKDDTPGCTLETKDFNSNLNKFKKLNCSIFGISKDSLKSHLKFKKKYKIKFQLLSDINKKVIKKYGVWGKKMFMGKNYMGIIRTTFLIDSNRKVLKIWNNVRVKDHAKDVYSEIKKIV